ncbi:sugar transferase [Jiella avicenniae]|uniref:Sugar transferase n=1 Tax=Jiella avicenniae TaxID=2907202 RepID=A0A9X1P3T2_9HYPH|nr:sugar transferase [Jiella avicenniae]MCE7030862.1 sugar transferase [Jiella avicenniae]
MSMQDMTVELSGLSYGGFDRVDAPMVREHNRSISRADGRQIGQQSALYVRWGFKRILDVVLASAILLFLLPAIPLILMALIIQDGSPIMFRQNRLGKGGTTFPCLKFRSMCRDSEAKLRSLLESCDESRMEWSVTQKLRRDPRIHPVGALLRKSSIDELPQLINVLKGEMSLVGPRPMLPEQAPMYGEKLCGYGSVRPGLTGLWQVSGRSALTFEQRVDLDYTYATRVTFLGDLKILLRTVKVVFQFDGSC